LSAQGIKYFQLGASCVRVVLTPRELPVEEPDVYRWHPGGAIVR